VRLTRLHLVAMGIAAEKVDQCIGVVLHGLRVASLDREGSYGHLASIGDCHSQPRDGRLYGLPAQRRWSSCTGMAPHTAGSTWQAGDMPEAEWGDTALGPGVRWVLTARETTPHRRRCVREYVEAVNLLRVRACQCRAQARLPPGGDCCCDHRPC
jgi:hypothetical protein